MFELITFLEFFTFIAGLSIAIYVFIKNPRNPLHLALALAALGMAGWNLSVFLAVHEIGPLEFVAQNAFAWATPLSVGFTWFVFLFPKKIKYYKVLTPLLFAFGIIFFLIPLHPDFILEVSVPAGYVDLIFDDFLYLLWTLYYVSSFFLTFGLLVYRYIEASGVNRNRLLQVILGFLCFFIPAQMSNLLLPFLFGDYRWNNLGPVFTIFLIAFLFNAVMRYRILDIKWIIGKSIVFSILIGTTLWLVFSSVLLLGDVVGGDVALFVAAFLIVLFYRPLEYGFRWLVRNLLSRGGYDPQKATEEVFSIVRDEGDLQKLLTLLGEKLHGYFIAEELTLLAFKPGSTQVLESVLLGKPKSKPSYVADLMKLVNRYKGKIVERNEIAWQLENVDRSARLKKQIAILDKADAEVIVPFEVDDSLIGLLIFGERKFDKALRDRDVEFLNLIRSAIAPALENAAKFAQIRELYEQLKETDKAKSEFIDVVSHRFRTPLSAIRWNIEAAQALPICKRSKDCVEVLSDAHNRTLFLTETLDRLFDSLAIDSGKLRLKKETFALKPALEEYLTDFRVQCQDKGIKFIEELATVQLTADKKRFIGTIKTLLVNALQYTLEGEIELIVERKNNKAIITVTDTGIGIPKDCRDKIYDKFYRAKNAILTYTDGQGLGLFFAKRIVELHKGKMNFTSIEGGGTKFVITLPLVKK